MLTSLWLFLCLSAATCQPARALGWKLDLPDSVVVQTTMVRVADSSALELHRIVEERQVDLMVLSAHGYSGEPRWPYGSISLNLIFYGASALLIVQDIAPGEIEPSQAELASKEKRGH